MSAYSNTTNRVILSSLGAFALWLGGIGLGASAEGASMLRVAGHMARPSLMAHATHMRRTQSSDKVTLSLTLPLRDPAGLADLIARQKDPADPLFGQYISPQTFAERFGPAADEYDQVTQFAANSGLKIESTHANRLVLTVSGSAAQVEAAFQLELHDYQMKNGDVGHAPSAEPAIPEALAPRISAVLGLETLSQRHTHVRVMPAAAVAHAVSGLGPADIKKAYGLDQLSLSGQGQSMALVELDGFKVSDINAYVANFGLNPVPPLQTVLVDGYNGAAGANAIEVTLDIELMMAVANGASKLYVYEGPNSDQGLVDIYSRIANDNSSKQISTSWGIYESGLSSAVIKSEATIFMQMAAQGQSMFSAAGDAGAYDDGSTLSVDDPGSQPYVTSVGGTRLSLGAGGAYASERTWGAPALTAATAEGGGGGISAVWPIPSWQVGLATAANLGSATMRMVPDVSLNSDPSTGYAVYSGGSFQVVGGTSCAAPLWAAFTALVNQQRVANAVGVLGYVNPVIYQWARSTRYATLFHDINDGSKNLFYPALGGYDLATGWGSFIGPALVGALASASPPPAAPAGVTASASSGLITVSWAASAGATSYQVLRGGPSSGGPYANIGAPVAGTNYIDSAVSNGVRYTYVVSAINAAGVSPYSVEANATPAAGVPAAPGSISAQYLGNN